MATEFVCKLRSAAGDYTTISSWHSAVACDLTVATTKVFSHGGITGTIADGSSVTGKTSLATGVAVHVTSTQILIKTISGTFQNGEQIYRVVDTNYVIASNAGDSAICVLECYNDWTTTGMVDNVTIQNFTTNATNYIIIRPASGQGHNGKVKNSDGTYTGFAFVPSSTTFAGLKIYQSYSRIQQIIVDAKSVTSTQPTGFSTYGSSYQYVYYERCIVCNVISSTSNGFSVHNLTRLSNCIAINCTNGFYFNNFCNAVAYNCSALFSKNYGFICQNNTGSEILKNCLTFGSSTGGFYFNNTITQTYCASGDGTADDFGGAGNIIYQQYKFINILQSNDRTLLDRNDYHLAPGDLGATSKGTNLTSDATYAVTVDIDNVARPTTGNWDIGADCCLYNDYICAIRASGGDYTTFSSWESANQCDLTSAATKVFIHSGITGTITDGSAVTGATSGATGTAVHVTSTQILIKTITGTFQGGEQVYKNINVNYVTINNSGKSPIAIAELYNDFGASGLQNVVTIAGWTTGANNYIVMRAVPSAIHKGLVNTGAKISNNSSTTYTFTVQQDYTQIYDLEIECNSTSNKGGITIGTTTYFVKIFNNMIRNWHGTRNAITTSGSGAGSIKAYIYNNIIRGNVANNTDAILWTTTDDMILNVA